MECDDIKMEDIYLGETEFINLTCNSIFGHDAGKQKKDCLDKFEQKDLSIMTWHSVNWTCYNCNEIFNDYITFLTHQTKLHGNANTENTYYPCRDCGQLLLGYASFLNHIRSIHYENLKLCCDVCSEMLPDYQQLAVHRDNHAESSNMHPIVYHCTHCEEVYLMESDVQSHLKELHNVIYNAEGDNESSAKTAKRKYKKRNIWSAHAEFLLLELWAKKIKELRSARKNGHVYKKIASTLKAQNVCVSAKEVKYKLANMSHKYRTEKASHGGDSEWQYYDKVHQILGSLEKTNVPSLKIADDSECEKNPLSPLAHSVISPPLSSPVRVSPFPSCISPEIVPSQPSEDIESAVSSSSLINSLSLPISTRPGRKKQSIQKKILKKMLNVETVIQKQNQEITNVMKEMLKTQKQNCNLLQQLVRSSVSTNKALVEFLMKHDF